MPSTVSELPAQIAQVFASFPPTQQEALVTTWSSATGLLPSAEQCIAWGMPSLRIDGELVLSMQGFGNHNSVFPGPGVIKALGSKLVGLTVTKGTIHFPQESPLKASLVKSIVAAGINEINASFPRSNGTFKEFYANGGLKAVGKMKSGEFHGQWKWFRRDGTVKRTGRFKDGQQVGTWITYDVTGRPYKETAFD